LRTIVQPTPPIARGYPYPFRWHSPVSEGEPAPFPAGCTLLADVALHAGGVAVATLSTEAGSIVRIDDTTIELRLSPADTAGLTVKTALIDLVRTDPSPDTWMGLKVQLPVEQPITAPRMGS
jgi:hypothetical protein